MSKNNLRKIDISNTLSKRKGFSYSYAKKLIDDLIDIIILEIKDGHLILKNIGTFKTIKKKERLGRNPKTLENFIISERNSVSFTASKKITNLINNIESD